MYIKRHLEDRIIGVSKTFPALLLTGARQVGKTTLLQHLKTSERKYVTLDDPNVRQLAVNDPEMFLQRFTPPLIIDEVQYAPQLFPYLKMAIDHNKKNGEYWLTGSQQFALMKNVTESLAGRIAILNLYGLSQSEIDNSPIRQKLFLPLPEILTARFDTVKAPNLKTVYEKIQKGQMPALFAETPPESSVFYSSYIQTYIQRDVRALSQIGDELSFYRFLKATAARTGQLLNKSELARDSGISPNTAENWLSILRASGIIYMMEPYYKNLTKRLIKSPKLYFLDTGLCAYLTDWLNWQTLETGALSGAIFETWVISEILKNFTNNGIAANIFYLRTKDGGEIDLLIQINGDTYPLEIKKTTNPTKKDIRQFHLLQKAGITPSFGGVICLCKQLLPLDAKNNAIPVSLF